MTATPLAAVGEASSQLDRVLEHASSRRRPGARGTLVRRALGTTDVLGLLAAFFVAEAVFGIGNDPDWWQNHVPLRIELILFASTLPVWVLAARLYGLYSKDEERTDHSTADDLVPVFHMLTVGVWLLTAAAWATRLVEPAFPKVLTFWGLAIVFLTGGRVLARHWCRSRPTYVQRVVIVGTGELPRLLARKIAQHPEYRFHLVGLVGDSLEGSAAAPASLVGRPEELPALINELDLDRVIVASEQTKASTELIHTIQPLGVQIDLVPRTYEVLAPGSSIHAIEGLPLLSLQPRDLSRSALLVKRALDVTLSLVGLVLASPLFAYIAWRIRRESPGSVFFRQTRLGRHMKPFTMLKFRTMRTGVDEAAHRHYIRAIMSRDAAPETNGLYKLERKDEITYFGRWLRATSLDELPQLLNVLRGQMSLVGPRPCLPYEVDHFEPHHFERFLVPPGLTGFWQVTARARSTFVEALEMDVAYARSWSLAFDFWLLCRTPVQLFSRKTTA